jgi:hypothetical protein
MNNIVKIARDTRFDNEGTEELVKFVALNMGKIGQRNEISEISFEIREKAVHMMQ